MQHYHTLSHQQQQQMLQLVQQQQQLQQQHQQHQLQQQQQQQQQHQHLPPHARHHPHPGGNPGHTMTMNRKIIEQNHYSEDNPPPLPPLRNPQKALEPVQAIPSLNDSSVNERDKQIYICSTLKTPNNGNQVNNGGNGNGTHYGTMRNNANAIKNQTTFNSTPPTTTKPLPSIINTPLPEIPSQPAQQQQQAPAPKDDIYVKRKFIDQNSKFATLKAIPLPKIEALEIEAQRKKMAQNAASGTPNGASASSVGSPLPPPPVTTMSSAMTTSQIQSLPLPPPPPELIEEEPLPPPPPPVELDADLAANDAKNNTKEVIYATKAIANNHGNNGGGNATNPTNANNGSDESSFYAVTEL